MEAVTQATMPSLQVLMGKKISPSYCGTNYGVFIRNIFLFLNLKIIVLKQYNWQKIINIYIYMKVGIQSWNVRLRPRLPIKCNILVWLVPSVLCGSCCLHTEQWVNLSTNSTVYHFKVTAIQGKDTLSLRNMLSSLFFHYMPWQIVGVSYTSVQLIWQEIQYFNIIC